MQFKKNSLDSRLRGNDTAKKGQIMPQTTGVLLVNLGTPTAPNKKAIRRYLAEFLQDPRVVELPRLLWLPILYGLVLPLRAKKLVHQYQMIWQKDGSPLFVLSKKLSLTLQNHLGENYQVELAMRYGKPDIQTGLEKLRHCDTIIVLPLYPQYSATTTASVFDKVTEVLQTWRSIPHLKFIHHYANEPLYIQALAQSIQQYIQQNGMPDKFIFSFHGLPKRCIDLGDPYQKQCEETVLNVVTSLNLAQNKWLLTYQSRFGKAKWLEPYTVTTLQSLAKENKNIAVICPGFAVDCLETLEEIAKTNRDVFLQAGGESFHYIAALNDNAAQVELLSYCITNF